MILKKLNVLIIVPILVGIETAKQFTDELFNLLMSYLINLKFIIL
jgi:hypothetical protein